MTRDDIVKWAQEAAIMPPDWGATENQWRSLEAFANLVAAAEREAIAKWYEDRGWMLDDGLVPDAIRERGAP